MSSYNEQPAQPAHLPFPDTSRVPSTQIQLQQPIQLTSFSYNAAHELEFSDSALRYYVDPPPGARLDFGFHRWTKRPDEKPRIDALLKAYSRVRKESALTDIGLVSWRGVMTKLLTAPYERDALDINIMNVGGTMYFEEHLTDDQLRNKNEITRRHRMMMYYGYAFESYCTSATPTRTETGPARGGDPPGWGGDVDTNVQWCSVVKGKLGDIRMVIGGEVDCVRGKYTGQPDTFVELKTSQEILDQQGAAKFERKLLKFYFQSFLLGVPDIVVGFRTPAGVLNGLQHYQTMQIPRMVRGRGGTWNAIVCMGWGYELLSFIRKKIAADTRNGAGEDAVWRARVVPGTGAQLMKLDRAGVEEVSAGEDRIGFLPRWYWQESLGNL
ncbi:RAI1-domain-containing protein [Amanita rubescens]|nr:RAI1-domain-containing protein [Amanita rubescens]